MVSHGDTLVLLFASSSALAGVGAYSLLHLLYTHNDDLGIVRTFSEVR